MYYVLKIVFLRIFFYFVKFIKKNSFEICDFDILQILFFNLVLYLNFFVDNF